MFAPADRRETPQAQAKVRIQGSKVRVSINASQYGLQQQPGRYIRLYINRGDRESLQGQAINQVIMMHIALLQIFKDVQVT